jgi:ketosteroid isomerase-like protein
MALLAAGCGSERSHTQTRAQRVTTTLTSPATPAPLVNPDQPLPAPGPTGVPAATAAVNVIRAWSDALRNGDVQAAARYFALPSVMINGTDATGTALEITIGTQAEAAAANATLPCGARLVSADQRGRYVNALFRLTGRRGPGGTDCGGGVGTTARTNFVIAHGRIVEWLRAPDDPGDNGTPSSPQPTPAPNPGLQPSPPTV